MAGQPGLLDLDERYRAFSAAGDVLERVAGAVEFELFGRLRNRLRQRRPGPSGVLDRHASVSAVANNLPNQTTKQICHLADDFIKFLAHPILLI